MQKIAFETESQQGPINAGFQVNLEGNYVALVGANNAAKTSILQAIFKKFFNQTNSKGRHRTCLILPERIFVDTTTQTGLRTLEQYNGELAGTIGGGNANRSYQFPNYNPFSSELPKLLLNHWNFVEQYHRINTYLQYFGLQEFILNGPQEISFEDIQVAVQGSGLRSIFAILAALTDEHLKLLLIDEPEESLEAGVQKLLRDLMHTVSMQRDMQIIVTTHSHLFLNRKDFTSNYAVRKDNGQVSIERVRSVVELYDITFKMLGSSVEDLFFLYNYMVVEGGSDEVIVNKVMTLKGISSARIKVLSAASIENVGNILYAVSNNITPFIVNDSPYKSRVVALIDKPHDTSEFHYTELKRVLGDRLYELQARSLEEYLPASLYEKCELNKEEVIEKIKQAKNDHNQVSAIKAEVSNKIAGSLTVEDLPKIPTIADAIDKANA